MNWIPHVTVAAVIERDQRFLLVEETWQSRLMINQPAGHWEKSETLIEAVQRETLEETGWHFVPAGLIGIYHYHSPHNDTTYLRFCFWGNEAKQQHSQPLDAVIVRTLWLTRAEIAALPDLRSPMVLQCVDDYLVGKRYPLSLLQSA